MVVIVGAGIAGAATAYYYCCCRGLTTGERVVLVDAVGPAACSSGNVGAFVSSHWGEGTKRQALFRESFALHQQLAKELHTPFHVVSAHRRVDIKESSLLVVGENKAEKQGTRSDVLEDDSGSFWMDQVNSFDTVPGKSAIVDPRRLTQALVDDAVDKGASLLINSVSNFGFDDDKTSVSVIRFEDETTMDVQDGEAVVIAIGPWSSRVEDWFDTPLPIDGILSTSMTWQDTASLPYLNSALFCNEDSNACHLEILPRYDQSLYVSGCGGSTVSSPQTFRSPQQRPRPQDPCLPNSARANAAQKSLAALLGQKLTPPDAIQACIRPIAPDGVPVMGKLSSRCTNVYVVTGGGPWGITWGPLMGKCMAHLLWGHDPSMMPAVRLASYTPRRFDTLLYRTFLRQRQTDDPGFSGMASAGAS